MIPHFPAIGSGGMPPVPPTILMSANLVLVILLKYNPPKYLLAFTSLSWPAVQF